MAKESEDAFYVDAKQKGWIPVSGGQPDWFVYLPKLSKVVAVECKSIRHYGSREMRWDQIRFALFLERYLKIETYVFASHEDGTPQIFLPLRDYLWRFQKSGLDKLALIEQSFRDTEEVPNADSGNDNRSTVSS